MSNGDGVVKTRTEQLKSHQHQNVKQHLVFDSPASKRIKYIFTAPVDTPDGGPCTCTEYVYLDASSTLVADRQERDYRWKAAWESDFVFNVSADIDPDGDGYL